MYTYDVGPYSRCTAPAKQCGLGDKLRVRQCVNSLGLPAPDSNCSAVVIKPQTTQQCAIPKMMDRLQTAIMDCTCSTDAECPGGTVLNAELQPNGVCVGGWCSCHPLYMGADCQVEIPIVLDGCGPLGRRDGRGRCTCINVTLCPTANMRVTVDGRVRTCRLLTNSVCTHVPVVHAVTDRLLRCHQHTQ
jgi:hypothetical protein